MLNRYYRRVKRNRLFWLLIALVIVLSLCLLFFLTDIFAPFGVVSPIKNPGTSVLEWICQVTDNRQSIYVELEDVTLYDTGIQWGTEQSKRNVCLLQQEGRWVILLKDEPLEKIQMDHCSGYFSAEYGDETIEKLISEVVDQQYRVTKKGVVSVVLEEVDFTATVVLAVIYFSVLLLVLIFFFICLVQMIDPRHSKTMQKLSYYGDMDRCIQMIETELSQSEREYPIYTKNWIFARGGFAMLELIPLFDIAWYHESQLKNPDGEDSYGLVFYCYSRKIPIISWSTAESEISEMKALAERLATEMPWIDSGYRKEKSKLWRQNKRAFLQKYGRGK